jgi:hypothetical protein
MLHFSRGENITWNVGVIDMGLLDFRITEGAADGERLGATVGTTEG